MTSPLPLSSSWTFAPGITFLNHGSFGACPVTVRAAQDRLRDRLELEPCAFMVRELEPLLDAARAKLAAFGARTRTAWPSSPTPPPASARCSPA